MGLKMQEPSVQILKIEPGPSQYSEDHGAAFDVDITVRITAEGQDLDLSWHFKKQTSLITAVTRALADTVGWTERLVEIAKDAQEKRPKR